MANLTEELAHLLNPTPVFKDPEDPEDDAGAKLVDSREEFDSSDVGHSHLRKKTITLLGDVDRKYAGKRTSRKKLVEDDDNSEEDDGEESLNDSDDGIGDEEEEEEELEESSEDESENENIADFQSKLKLQSTKGEFSFQDDGDFGKYGDDDSEGEEDDSDDEGGDDDEVVNDDEDDEENNLDDDDGDEVTSEEEGIQKFSAAGKDEIEKGKAAKQQLGLWDSLLESRIKLQKAVSIINQLPQSDSWESFEEKEENFAQEALQTQDVLKHILDSLVHLQDILLHQNTETKHLAGHGSKDQAHSAPAKIEDDDDEEIPSDTDEEVEEKPVEIKPDVKLRKRKLNMEEYPEFLAKRHKDFKEYRNSTIQRWNDKTKLSGGKIKGKSFSAFDQSAIAQINQILGDKDRLIKRTQLKRSVYTVLGKTEKTEESDDNADDNATEEKRVTKDHLKDYDTEIFDDSDFYHQLLRELIEKKTSDISDPVALSRQWLEIQKLRGRSKKSVDTRASKGRKIRYDVHKKLVNFMASIDACDWSDEARDDLFKSLFGKRFVSAVS